jgi:hypothetical protein
MFHLDSLVTFTKQRESMTDKEIKRLTETVKCAG